MEKVAVAKVSDFSENTMDVFEVNGKYVVVIYQGGKFYAVPDQCTHAKFPLHDGEILEGKIKCIHHGACFDLETGKPTLPAVKPIRLYQTEVIEDTVYVIDQENQV
jgi:3-phenylpropionate/trans-cinnamate dioxygenase ferredoxin component